MSRPEPTIRYMCFLHFVHFCAREQSKVPKKAENKIIFKVRGEESSPCLQYQYLLHMLFTRLGTRCSTSIRLCDRFPSVPDYGFVTSKGTTSLS
jgi:hypothetical protein